MGSLGIRPRGTGYTTSVAGSPTRDAWSSSPGELYRIDWNPMRRCLGARGLGLVFRVWGLG